jgi:hypothetical protein
MKNLILTAAEKSSMFSVANVLLFVLGILTLAFTVVFVKDLMDHKDKFEKDTNFIITFIIGVLANFFDTLGIGSFAPTTSALRFTKQTEDRLIPGTLNVACCIPVITEAFIFISSVEVEPVTLASMLIAATVGSYLGAGIVSKLPTKQVQLLMGVALFVTGGIFALQILGLFPKGDENSLVMGLSGAKLIVAVVINFFLGALMTAGIGLYAPCMALVLLLGMNPKVAFPVMMGSCAYLMPVASIKFVKEGAYNRVASLAITIGGVIGVLIAAFIVKSLPLNILKILVTSVIFYTSITLFLSAVKKAEANRQKS